MKTIERPLALLVSAAFLALASTGCGGGGEPDLTARDISDEELSLMALSLADLGEEYAGLPFDEDSGFETNADTIQTDADPEDQAQDVERFGRIKGYERFYLNEQAIAATKGAYVVGSGIELFRDARGASGEFEDGPADLERNVGVEHEGWTIEKVERFPVADIADDSIGVSGSGIIRREDGGTVPFHLTIVAFRRGRLLGSAFLIRLDDQDVRAHLEGLARKLNERIQAVLAGEAVVTPTPDRQASPRQVRGAEGTGQGPGVLAPEDR